VIKRLRTLDLDEIDRIYQTPHDHRIYGHGHHLRVEQSKLIVRWLVDWMKLRTVVDLSCGNGAIANAALPFGATVTLGDFAPGYPIQGPLERTLLQVDPMDLYICCETLEHLDNPRSVLDTIGRRAKWLVLSTPIGVLGDGDDSNFEHQWQWDKEGVDEMLDYCQLKTRVFVSLDSRYLGETYNYGLWVCEA